MRLREVLTDNTTFGSNPITCKMMGGLAPAFQKEHLFFYAFQNQMNYVTYVACNIFLVAHRVIIRRTSCKGIFILRHEIKNSHEIFTAVQQFVSPSFFLVQWEYESHLVYQKPRKSTVAILQGKGTEYTVLFYIQILNWSILPLCLNKFKFWSCLPHANVCFIQWLV